MKKIIFLSILFVAVIFGISCQETETTAPTYDKHNIQNDTNWVEITDTIHFYSACLFMGQNKYFTSFVINDSNTYNNLKYYDAYCNDSKYPYIDFAKKTLLIYSFEHGCIWDDYYHVYRNDIYKKYLFLIVRDIKEPVWILEKTATGIIIPKIKNNYTVDFDTLNLGHCAGD
ncbi:MAG: hypothetical protein EPN82_04035 [Bacteroidetes bacterium]|nr:MAG: hypothetical protein EPN82_04035 [Bacteroidota bacterium]